MVWLSIVLENDSMPNKSFLHPFALFLSFSTAAYTQTHYTISNITESFTIHSTIQWTKMGIYGQLKTLWRLFDSQNSRICFNFHFKNCVCLFLFRPFSLQVNKRLLHTHNGLDDIKLQHSVLSYWKEVTANRYIAKTLRYKDSPCFVSPNYDDNVNYKEIFNGIVV